MFLHVKFLADTVHYGKPFLHQGISELGKNQGIALFYHFQVLGLFHLFFSAVAIIENIQQRQDGFFTSGLDQLDPFPGGPAFKIVKFCDEADVFIFLFFQFLPEFFQFRFICRFGIGQVCFSRNIGISIDIHRLVVIQRLVHLFHIF